MKKHKNIIVYHLDSSRNSYYVRAGNHSFTVLSAMNEDIPFVLGDIIYLKPGDKSIHIKKLFCE